MPRMTLEERLMSKVVWNGDEDECWDWQAALNKYGYGKFNVSGRVLGAHRVSYELFVGEIPADLVLDHLCRNRACVNPAHLQAVRQQVNLLRGVGINSVNAAKTHCPRGHLFDEQNTYDRGDGSRQCRACRKRQRLEFEERRQASRVA